MTEQEVRNKVVSTAKAWLGCNGRDGSHKPIIDLYNSHKPLARGYKVTYTDSWCATFVSAVAIKCGYTGIMPTECSCNSMITLYKNIGRWQENDAYRPSTGDIIMYDWDDSGKGDCTGNPEHVGIVVSVGADNTIKVIEGNISNAVGYRDIKVNGRYIRGYCLPDYKKKETVNNTTTNNQPSGGKEDNSSDMMTQEQFNSMMDKYLEAQSKKQPNTWSADARLWAESIGLIKGDQNGNKQYRKLLTKEETVQMLYNYSKGS